MEFIKIDRKKCGLCGGCVSVCPVKVIIMHKDRLEISDGCIKCEKCIKVCPVEALSKNG
ncbi:MAG: 4Fe-4S binding protein [bacterium]|nr:4Fe-4S binding protein [bacterium]